MYEYSCTQQDRYTRATTVRIRSFDPETCLINSADANDRSNRQLTSTPHWFARHAVAEPLAEHKTVFSWVCIEALKALDGSPSKRHRWILYFLNPGSSGAFSVGCWLRFVWLSRAIKCDNVLSVSIVNFGSLRDLVSDSVGGKCGSKTERKLHISS